MRRRSSIQAQKRGISMDPHWQRTVRFGKEHGRYRSGARTCVPRLPFLSNSEARALPSARY